jgi:hypothetical protein
MTGDARAEEREPRRGRHRRGPGGEHWTPEVPRAVDCLAPAIPGPRDSAAASAFTWPDPAATGLRKFNLGTIPASVTPPRTWRRAAAFAIGTAVLVVVGLSVATYTLVGNPRRGTTIGLPGQPSQNLIIRDLPGDVGTTNPAHPSPTPTASRPATTTRQPATPPRTNTPRPTGADAVVRPAPAPSQPQALAGRPAGPTPPARSTISADPTPVSDPQKMGDRTELYYAQVTSNPAAACALTAGAMRAEGPEGIEARYVDVQRVEVKDITIDPSWSFTRSTLVIVHRDGTTTTEHRELTFSHGSDPKITSDDPA